MKKKNGGNKGPGSTGEGRPEVKQETKPEEKAEEKADGKTEEEKPEEKADELKPVKKTPKKKKSEMWKRAKVTTKMFLHVTKMFLLFTVGILAAAAIILLIYHSIKKGSEKQYLSMPGTQVEVDGKYLHVIKGGKADSDVTLVFLHGDKTADDCIVLQPLFKEVEEDAAYIYVDRAGVGFSDDDGGDRDVDSLVTETRTAIQKAGAKEPYVLVPEGTAGIMALHWANKYPDEVRGIFGIGMVYPEQFEDVEPSEYCGVGDWITKQLFRIGANRIFGSMKPTNPAGAYTDAQMDTRRALVNRGAYTDDMYKEDRAMVDSARTVMEEGWPEDLPITLIYGNPVLQPYLDLDEDMKQKVENAKANYPDADIEGSFYEEQKVFFEKKKNVTYIETDGPVRLAIYAPKTIGAEIRNYLKNTEMK